MDSKVKEKGHKCNNCARYHKWSAYVFAHWNDPIIHTCECGQTTRIIEGDALPLTIVA